MKEISANTRRDWRNQFKVWTLGTNQTIRTNAWCMVDRGGHNAHSKIKEKIILKIYENLFNKIYN
jgi:hypothetical protein